jgi:hypothetical protein
LGGWSLLDGVPKSAKKRKLADGSRAIEVGVNMPVVRRSVRFWPSDEKTSMRERALIRGKGVLL